MMIVFVYDTAKCCKEEDDPAEAVMYFHPAWVSLTQRLALAGQLMGVYHFLTTSFSAPRSITLQGGKFVLKKFGQYVLVSTFYYGATILLKISVIFWYISCAAFFGLGSRN